jgi:sRNA-binding regulator protein Hfq
MANQGDGQQLAGQSIQDKLLNGARCDQSVVTIQLIFKNAIAVIRFVNATRAAVSTT